MKKIGYNGHTGLGRGKPCKIFGRKQQKIEDGACPNQREGVWKSFEKVIWLSQIWLLEKLIHDFRLIEIDRSSHKILNVISIDRKIDWINQNSGKTEFLKK